MKSWLVWMSTLTLVSGLLMSPVPMDAKKEATYKDPKAPVDERVADLMSRMTLEEKIGQMVQAERQAVTPEDVKRYKIGSILSGGGSAPEPNTPEAWAEMIDDFQKGAMAARLQVPIIYGVDAVHGHNNVKGATIFPHNIGLGATRDTELVKRIAKVTAEEVRTTGVHWNFAPVLAAPQNIRWGRTYEGFSEDPEWVSEMGAAYVEGLQGSPNHPHFLGRTKAVATAKHWVGDGATTDGKDQGNVELTEEELQKFIDPYRSAIDAGARTVMVSFSSWNGLKTHADRYLVTEVLKEQLGFDGLVVSDWNGVQQTDPDFKQAVKKGLHAGIDMFMMPYEWKEFLTTTEELVASGEVPVERIDDAVSRILRVKFEMGLFEKPYTDRGLKERHSVGSKAHRKLAREAVRKSLVLLKNENNILPLSKDEKIFVAGEKADDIGIQCGGWTISWQGSSGNITPGTTILEGIKKEVKKDTAVTYSKNGIGAEGHDVALVVVGEQPYAEYEGDRDHLDLNEADLEVLENVKKSGVPTVVVTLSGRPLMIRDHIEDWDGLVAAWLPGTEGQGVADVLFGEYPFTGKLSFTWPKRFDQIPMHPDDENYDPLYPIGYGLSAEKN
ncbi:glycoside hydrolase family 3 protein [Paludifilum halophilum]|uniref:beta-glucosidase n=1 Tax=Paludifilum halophilum TaxID=1642702 RepID=A0A235B3L3_9BACL|nr:glycoside hydrolase family 3 N-terminal domain-containing protein [Paludifilum halophilum]OYD06874.1 beta-glucosidase [Paludifilum halophilum]